MDLNWNDSYSLGDLNIDKEHKKLFAIAHKAFGTVSPDKKVAKIKTVFTELMNYTKTHFKHEEKFMESIGYPELPTQKRLHQEIIDAMHHFGKNLSKMSIMEIEKELAHGIELWFIHHIVYVDKKIVQWQLTHEIPDFIFNWDNSYSVENTLIDAQHQELFKIASQAFKKVPQEKKMQKIKDTLEKLFQYFQQHFKDEEEYMKEIKYDKLDNHIKIHQTIIKNLNDFIKAASKMTIEEIETKLKDFIEDSLVEHILQEDKKIASWNKYLLDLKEAKKLKEI